MALRFFRKFGPATKVVLSNNSFIQFPSNDGLQGFFSTDNPFVLSEFDRFKASQKYGIVEIDEAEYRAFEEKKTQSPILNQPWREEMGNGHRNGVPLSAQVGAERVAAAVAVKGCDNQRSPCGQTMSDAPITPAQPVTVADTVPAAAQKKTFTPTIGKRKKSE